MEKNKEIVRRLYEECLNKRNFELLNVFIANDYAGSKDESGPAGFAGNVQSIIKAFPDIQWKVEYLIAEDNKVVVRWSWQGTHTDTFRGFFPATQKQVTDHAIAIYEFDNYKIVKASIQTDRLGFLQQLGIIPQDLNTLSSLKTSLQITPNNIAKK